MTKKLGQDFQALKASARQIPGVREYLHSFPAIIGDLVMARRIQMGLSQEKLAELAETTQATISRIESGDEGVKLGTLSKVFDVLGITGITPHFSEEAAASAN
ncbi:DNA-binding XRE family transcriptional regulator [Brevibacillus aydinogluensis]|jgi:DNA-binding XRE family transcriptional regulator|uniref:helix-turn-helix domain-containing protein n=1 Tax=Brevibacillus aydinogluensis TaxID=927786 RepID=UPI002893266C|nr:helix-turn-helix domain-containing protein [Brevibacillus aydinogluensis]MDT3417093.1 DNA-binding XRE family transcriptional regulator [Brevibacillus aydinogluensis]